MVGRDEIRLLDDYMIPTRQLLILWELEDISMEGGAQGRDERYQVASAKSFAGFIWSCDGFSRSMGSGSRRQDMVL